MPRLCVLGCSPNPDIRFHSFPSLESKPKSFHAWVQAIGGKLETPEDYVYYKKKRICDRHFTVESKVRNNRVSFIGVPSLYLSGFQETTAEVTPMHIDINLPAKTSDLVTSGVPLHRFPKPEKRQDLFDKWVAAVGDSLKECNPQKIYANKRVCDHHFMPCHKTDRNRLTSSAIPCYQLICVQQTLTTFVQTDHSYCHPKRAQDVLENDIADTIEINLENNEAQHDDVQFVDELRLEEDPETLKHSDFRCNVCRGQIVGFRYVCVQCVDWDMCASCEARGEHPEHYVLRLPAPKPYAECEPVIAAIREQIEHLLLLSKEIKSEVYFEAETNMDDIQDEFDPNLTDPFSATTDRNVIKLNLISKTQSDIVAEIEANISDVNTQPATDRPQTAPKLILIKSRSAPGDDRNVPELNISKKTRESVASFPDLNTVSEADTSQKPKFILTNSTGLAPGVDRNVPKFNVIPKEQSDMVADTEANIPDLNTDPVTVRPQTPKLILARSSGLAPGVRMILDKSTTGGPTKRVYIINSTQKAKILKKVKRKSE